MDDLVKAYLAAHPYHHETTECWPVQGNMLVRLALGQTLPPACVSSSILAIVLSPGRRVLYLWPSTPTGSIAHLLIGGRPVEGETPEQTAVREVGEETGWRIRPIRMIGFRHFHQLEPRNPNTDRPYPDFIQPIYAAVALDHDPALLLAADQIPAEFVDLATTEQRLEAGQQPLLHAAIAAICPDP